MQVPYSTRDAAPCSPPWDSANPSLSSLDLKLFHLKHHKFVGKCQSTWNEMIAHSPRLCSNTLQPPVLTSSHRLSTNICKQQNAEPAQSLNGALVYKQRRLFITKEMSCLHTARSQRSAHRAGLLCPAKGLAFPQPHLPPQCLESSLASLRPPS